LNDVALDSCEFALEVGEKKGFARLSTHSMMRPGRTSVQNQKPTPRERKTPKLPINDQFTIVVSVTACGCWKSHWD